LSLDGLVAWAESAMMDGEFDPAYLPTIRDVVARIGVADVRAFGLTWEDCEQLLAQFGYSEHINIVTRCLPTMHVNAALWRALTSH
jgi:hypothetical protein